MNSSMKVVGFITSELDGLRGDYLMEEDSTVNEEVGHEEVGHEEEQSKKRRKIQRGKFVKSWNDKRKRGLEEVLKFAFGSQKWRCEEIYECFKCWKEGNNVCNNKQGVVDDGEEDIHGRIILKDYEICLIHRCSKDLILDISRYVVCRHLTKKNKDYGLKVFDDILINMIKSSLQDIEKRDTNNGELLIKEVANLLDITNEVFSTRNDLRDTYENKIEDSKQDGITISIIDRLKKSEIHNTMYNIIQNKILLFIREKIHKTKEILNTKYDYIWDFLFQYCTLMKRILKNTAKTNRLDNSAITQVQDISNACLSLFNLISEMLSKGDLKICDLLQSNVMMFQTSLFKCILYRLKQSKQSQIQSNVFKLFFPQEKDSYKHTFGLFLRESYVWTRNRIVKSYQDEHGEIFEYIDSSCIDSFISYESLVLENHRLFIEIIVSQCSIHLERTLSNGIPIDIEWLRFLNSHLNSMFTSSECSLIDVIKQYEQWMKVVLSSNDTHLIMFCISLLDMFNLQWFVDILEMIYFFEYHCLSFVYQVSV